MTNSSPNFVKVFCGELCSSNSHSATEVNILNREINGIEANINVGYDRFVKDPESLPQRILDLLNIAAHIYCADRLVHRGERKSLDNNAWARSFEFHFPVLDLAFWNRQEVKNALSEALTFMTGDRIYNFVFEQSALGHLPKTEYKQLSIFKDEVEYIEGDNNTDVLLFSGGLDSLAGVVERLNSFPNNRLIVVSHKSNHSVTHTQNQITDDLKKRYDHRLLPYGFECHLRKMQSKEETQRTRMFLFSSIAFAICNCADKHNFYVYENGITSINLPTQTDAVNARTSRTTHPKTLGLMKNLFRFFDADFDIVAPYYNKTKEDIFKVFETYNEKNLLRSSVSCSSTRSKPGTFSHCGCCSQCIDRHFAAYAASLDEYDVDYTDDFIAKIPNDETRQRLWQTLRLASAEKMRTTESLFKNYPEEMVNLVEHWNCDNAEDCVTDVHLLFSRYGDSIMRAVKSIQVKHENLSVPIADDSFLSMLSSREYLKTPMQIRVEEIDKMLRASIPKTFHSAKPTNENDFSNKVEGLLTAAGNNFTREYPVLKFGITSYRADISDDELIIESKYLRNKTTPSVVTDGIAADIIKAQDAPGILFIIYDPERKIVDDIEFCRSFETKRDSCYVRIYR